MPKTALITGITGQDGSYRPELLLNKGLQQDEADDYVVATGKTHSVRDFAELAFQRVGLDWRDHVVIDKKLYRPADVFALQGDSSKARERLGWVPKVGFTDLVNMMVDADMALVGGGSRSG